MPSVATHPERSRGTAKAEVPGRGAWGLAKHPALLGSARPQKKQVAIALAR